jgi:hypothetical protein
MANDEELAALTAANATEFVAPNVPVHLRDQAFVDHRFLEPDRLEHSRCRSCCCTALEPTPSTRTSFDHLADLLTDVHVREIDGAGHMGPLLAP